MCRQAEHASSALPRGLFYDPRFHARRAALLQRLLHARRRRGVCGRFNSNRSEWERDLRKIVDETGVLWLCAREEALESLLRLKGRPVRMLLSTITLLRSVVGASQPVSAGRWPWRPCSYSALQIYAYIFFIGRWLGEIEMYRCTRFERSLFNFISPPPPLSPV